LQQAAAAFLTRPAGERVDTVPLVATREDLHRSVDALSEAQVERARIIIVDEVDKETSVESILVRHGEQRLSGEEFEHHFGGLPRDGEG